MKQSGYRNKELMTTKLRVHEYEGDKAIDWWQGSSFELFLRF